MVRTRELNLAEIDKSKIVAHVGGDLPADAIWVRRLTHNAAKGCLKSAEILIEVCEYRSGKRTKGEGASGP